MKFFDAHLHNLHRESGGFLVGLEGAPVFPGTLSNGEVMEMHDPESGYCSFFYVTREAAKSEMRHGFLKYHPRREKYSPAEVSASIRLNSPSCAMIDTLNEPYWSAGDYWSLARDNPDVTFIFPHAGGYMIQEFIKICHFQPNVWLDFSLTHELLGAFGRFPGGLPYIHEAIVYSLNSVFKGRVLMSSDYPFYSQEDAVKYYSELGCIKMLDANFSNLLERITR